MLAVLLSEYSEVLVLKRAQIRLMGMLNFFLAFSSVGTDRLSVIVTVVVIFIVKYSMSLIHNI